MSVKASKQQITNYIAVLRVKQDLYNQVREVLAAFDGKKITKALATAVEKKFPSLSVYYNPDAFGSWYSLTVWGAAVKYENKMDLQLGYLSEGPLFSLKRFDELNINHTKYLEWAEAAQKSLDNYDALAAEFLTVEQAFLVAQGNLGAIGFNLSNY